MNEHDVIISGIGVISGLARNAPAHIDALALGTSALQADPMGSEGTQWAPMEAPVLRNSVPDALETQVRFLNRAGEAAVEAAREAMLHAQLATEASVADTEDPHPRRGLFLAQVDGSNWDCNEFWPSVLQAPRYADGEPTQESYNRAAARHVKPYFILEDLKNNAFSFIATWFGLGGANSSATGYAGPALTLVNMAARSIRLGELDVALVVAAANPLDAIARAEARMRLDLPLWSPGEGGAALVLESKASAIARDVNALAVLDKYRVHSLGDESWAAMLDGVSCDAYLSARVSTLPNAIRPIVSWDAAWGDMAMTSDLATLALGAQSLASSSASDSIGLLTQGLRGECHVQTIRRLSPNA